MLLNTAKNIYLGSKQVNKIYLGSQLIWQHSQYSPESDFTYFVNSDNTATITSYNGTDANVSVPPTLGGHKVVTLYGTPVFTNKLTLKSVIIPEGVKTLTGYLFNSCSALEELHLPSTITTINTDWGVASAYYLFANITSQVTNVTIANGFNSNFSTAILHSLPVEKVWQIIQNFAYNSNKYYEIYVDVYNQLTTEQKAYATNKGLSLSTNG